MVDAVTIPPKNDGFGKRDWLASRNSRVFYKPIMSSKIRLSESPKRTAGEWCLCSRGRGDLVGRSSLSRRVVFNERSNIDSPGGIDWRKAIPDSIRKYFSVEKVGSRLTCWLENLNCVDESDQNVDDAG